MKNLIYLFACVVIMASCQTKKENVAYLKGKVVSGNFKEIRLQWMNEKAIDFKGETYLAAVADDGTFSFQIPVNEMVNGRMVTDNYFHSIILMPGDDVFVRIDTDTVEYSGKGAAKNNFLYTTESSGVWQYRDQLYQQRLPVTEFISSIQIFKQKRDSLIINYVHKAKLEPSFIDYYHLDVEVECESSILGYASMMSYMQQLPIDSLELPQSYYDVASFNKVLDDERLISGQYLHLVSSVMRIQAQKLMDADTSLTEELAKIQLFKDSIGGLTKSYALAQWLYSSLSYDEYNEAAIAYFNTINADEKAKVFVNKAVEKYQLKKSLVGEPLSADMLATVLEDTAGNSLTFGDVMHQFKGKVVYLDMWSLGCGPCRMAMPYSKMMKEQMKELPIEFLYLTSDRASENLWQEVFEVSQTHDNHYRLVNGFDSKINQLFEIFWVPNYMIIDKEGKLVDYKADRPTEEVETMETELMKQLKALALQ